jgi:hypothetical protein
MSELIIEYKNSITEFICDEIIEKFEQKNELFFEIPKDDKDWNKIERTIYKQLLININKYKSEILKIDTGKKNELYNSMNELYTKHFTIIKIEKNMEKDYYNIEHKSYNRFNILNYVFFLNNITEGGQIINDYCDIKPKSGKLVIFPNDFDYKYKLRYPRNENQYIICGKLSSEI